MQIINVEVRQDGPHTVVEFVGEGDELVCVRMHPTEGSSDKAHAVNQAKALLVQLTTFNTTEIPGE